MNGDGGRVWKGDAIICFVGWYYVSIFCREYGHFEGNGSMTDDKLIISVKWKCFTHLLDETICNASG
jgi:hypothetical protein